MDKSVFMAYAGGAIRALVAWGCGRFAAGLVGEAEMQKIADAAVIAMTIGWSVWSKRKALKTVPPVVKAAKEG